MSIRCEGVLLLLGNFLLEDSHQHGQQVWRVSIHQESRDAQLVNFFLGNVIARTCQDVGSQ